MVRLVSLVAALSLWSNVEGVCNVDDHHPENGGYFIEGINGHDSELDPSSTSNRRMHNSTWAKGIEYADGSIVYCTGMFCTDTCRNEGCPTSIAGHTCSMIRFCYDADDGSDVWLMPDEMALAKCDFSAAELVCNATDGSDDDCCNYMVEEDADLKSYLFASKNGCEVGQKAAVVINDFASVGDQCYGMGLTTPRIASCTCQYEGGTSTLVEPCHSSFVGGCLHHAPDNYEGAACCDDATCVGKHKNYSHPIGMALEDDRKKLCRDDIPGRCVNSVDETDDCCTRTCSSCGTDISPYLSWAACDVGNGTASLGECGYGGHGGRFDKYECDFSQCPDDSAWAVSGDLYRDWMRTVDEPGYMKTLDIVDAAKALGLSTLVDAVVTAGLVETLQGEGPYIVFAPSNDAFMKLDNYEEIDADSLKAVLTNHVVAGPPTLLGDLPSGHEFTTLGGQTVTLDHGTDETHLNDARVGNVIGYSLSNGHLFVLEDVITEFSSSEDDARKTVLDILIEDGEGNFDTLIAAVETAGLSDTLRGEGPFTVFAPSDEAFETYGAVPTDVDELKTLLTNHVVSGSLTSDNVSDGDKYTTLGGETIVITVEHEGARVNDAEVNMMYYDKMASNGVVVGMQSVIEFDDDGAKESSEEESKEGEGEEAKKNPEDLSSAEGLFLSFRIAVASVVVACTLMR